MPTLYRNWTVTVQDSASPFSPISNLELHLYEGKVEIKVDPATGVENVFLFGTSTLANPVVDRYSQPAVALATDTVERPGEYDFIELDLNNTTLTPSSAAGSTLYSVVGRPENATDWASGRVIIDSTSLDDPNTKRTMATLGGGVGSVIDNIFFAGGTVKFEESGLFVSSASELYLTLTDLPQTIKDLVEYFSSAPPYYDDGSSPTTHTALMSRFNAFYSNGTGDVVATWKGIRAYLMSEGSIVIRLKSDQYSVYKTAVLGSGVGELNLLGIISELKVSVAVEEPNVNFRTFNVSPTITIPTTGAEGSLISVYKDVGSGLDVVGLGKWGYSSLATDAPSYGVDIKHSRGFRVKTADGLPYQLLVHSNGYVGIGNTATPTATLQVASNAAVNPHLNAGYNVVTSGAGSMALGVNCTASGPYSMAIGFSVVASGQRAKVWGFNSTASGQDSIAIGNALTVSGLNTLGINLDNLTSQTVSESYLFSILGCRVGIGTTKAFGSGLQPKSKLSIFSSSGLDDSPSVAVVNNVGTIGVGTSLGGYYMGGVEGATAHHGAAVVATASTAWASSRDTTLGLKIAKNGVLKERFQVSDAGVSVLVDSNSGDIITAISGVTGSGNLNLKINSGVGSSYFGHWFSLATYGAYFGNFQGLSANNAIIHSTSEMVLGLTTAPTSGEKLLVFNNLGNSLVAQFKVANATAGIAVTSLDTVLRTAYLSTNANGTENVTSLGHINGISAFNLNICYDTSITAYSRIGIGITAPANRLDVAGGMAIGTYAGTLAPANTLIIGGRLGIGTITPTAPLHIRLNGSINAAYFSDVGANTVVAAFYNTSSNIAYIGLSNTGFPFFGSVNGISSEIVIDPVNSRVGVLTATPRTALHVNGFITSGSEIRIRGDINNDGKLVFNANNYTTTLAEIGYNSSAFNALLLSVGGADRICIFNNGAISLNTSNPAGALFHQNTYALSGYRDGIYSDGNLAGGAALEHRGLLLSHTLANTISYAYYGLSVRESIGTGFTAPTYVGIHASDLGGLGTVTDCYGLYVDAMTRGTSNNVSAYFGGKVGIATIPQCSLSNYGSFSGRTWDAGAANYTVDTSGADFTIICNTTANDRLIYLPPISANKFRVLCGVAHKISGAKYLQIRANGSDLIAAAVGGVFTFVDTHTISPSAGGWILTNNGVDTWYILGQYP